MKMPEKHSSLSQSRILESRISAFFGAGRITQLQWKAEKIPLENFYQIKSNEIIASLPKSKRSWKRSFLVFLQRRAAKKQKIIKNETKKYITQKITTLVAQAKWNLIYSPPFISH